MCAVSEEGRRVGKRYLGEVGEDRLRCEMDGRRVFLVFLHDTLLSFIDLIILFLPFFAPPASP